MQKLESRRKEGILESKKISKRTTLLHSLLATIVTMKLKLLFAFILIWPPVLTLGSDELPPPDLVLHQEVAVSNFTTSEPQLVLAVDIDLTKLESEIFENIPKDRSLYQKLLEKIRDSATPKIRQLFNRFQVKKETQDLIIGDVERQLKEGPEMIAKATASGVQVRLNLQGQLGLGDIIIKAMANSQWGRRLKFLHLEDWGKWRLSPARFGLAFAVGLGVLSFEKDGKRYLVLRGYTNGEYPEKVINVMAEAFTGVAIEKVSENIALDTALEKRMWVDYKNMQRMNLGPAGTMIADEKAGVFVHDIGFGPPWLAGLGQISFYMNRVHQLRFNFVVSMNWYDNLKNRFRKSCRKAVARPVDSLSVRSQRYGHLYY